MAAFTIGNTLRPCLVGSDKKKCLFHGFWQNSDIYPPSLLKGGHNGGVVAGPVALVETEDGDVIKVEPALITFIDRKIEEYSFGEETHERQNVNNQT